MRATTAAPSRASSTSEIERGARTRSSSPPACSTSRRCRIRPGRRRARPARHSPSISLFLSSPQIIPLKHIGVPDDGPTPRPTHRPPALTHFPHPQHAYKLRALPTRAQRERAEVNLGNERLAEWCEVGALYCGFRPQADVTIRDTPLPEDDGTANGRPDTPTGAMPASASKALLERAASTAAAAAAAAVDDDDGEAEAAAAAAAAEAEEAAATAAAAAAARPSATRRAA